MKASITKTSFKKIFILLFWLVIWEIFALIVNKEIYLPSPISTFKTLILLLIDKSTYIIILFSTYRTILGLLLSCIFGIILGFACGLNEFLYDLINPIVIVIRSTPIISIIILAIIWLKSSNVPVFATFLMCFPVIFTNVSTGIKNTDKKVLEMCKVYNISKFNIIKSVYFHSVLPYIYSAIISSIGIAWKASSAAEVLSVPKYSIGKYLFYAKTSLEPTSLFSWTIIIVTLSYIFEVIFKRVFKGERKSTYNKRYGVNYDKTK